jgi:hypothetical protein
MTRVALHVDTRPSSRTSPVRDNVMSVAFSARTTQAQAAAEALATKVSLAMDLRSEPSLFLVAAYRENASHPDRQVALWVFPRGEGFRFDPRRHRIQPVGDYFDRKSTWRKLAFFTGKDVRTHFLEADVLDMQASATRNVADLWSERFLEAGLAITKEGGTRMLAQVFSKTSMLDLPITGREQLNAAVMALRQTPQQRWSVRAVADQFLDAAIGDQFIAQAPNYESSQSLFALDKDLFGRTLNFRVFKLEGDIYVSSPLEQIGDGKIVMVESVDSPDGRETTGEQLRVKGAIVEDRLRQRRG